MTKTGKKILTSILLAMLLVLSVFAITACGGGGGGGEGENTVTYTVTVMQDETTPASGVKVRLSKGETRFPVKATDANGKATFELAPDDYTVTISGIPDHYSLPENTDYTLSATKHDLTVTLKANFTYTVHLVNPDKTPFTVEGVRIGICTDKGCLDTVPLENGTAILEAAPDEYHVQILFPDAVAGNYDFSRMDDNPNYYADEVFTATFTEMTITIYPKSTTVLDLSSSSLKKMTNAEKDAFATANNKAGYNSAAQTFDAVQVSRTLAAHEVAYFNVKPNFSGTYHYYTNSAVTYESTSINGVFLSQVNYVAGKTYEFKVVNNSAATATAEFVLALPFSTYLEAESEGNYDLTIGKAGTCAVLAYTPTTSGVYQLTLPEGVIGTCVGTQERPGELVDNTDGWTSGSVEYLVSTNRVGAPIYFAITVTGSDSKTAKVELRKTADRQVIDVQISESLSVHHKPAGQELAGIPMNAASLELLTLDNGYYKYDGKTIYVKITELSRYEFALAYMDKNAPQFTYAFDDKDNAIRVHDYRVFLRGFKNYDYENSMTGQVAVIPTQKVTENYYANFVNEDGAYPLTAELKEFLELFYENNASILNYGFGHTEDKDDTVYQGYWLFPCYYYEEASDVIVGKYDFLSKTEGGEKLGVGDSKGPGSGNYSKDDYVLTVNNDNTFSITGNDSMGVAATLFGTWSKNGDTYTFTVADGALNADWESVDLTFTVTFETGYIKLVTDNENGDKKFNVTEWEFGTASANDE